MRRELLRLAERGRPRRVRAAGSVADGRHQDPLRRLPTVTRVRTLPDPTDATPGDLRRRGRALPRAGPRPAADPAGRRQGREPRGRRHRRAAARASTTSRVSRHPRRDDSRPSSPARPSSSDGSSESSEQSPDCHRPNRRIALQSVPIRRCRRRPRSAADAAVDAARRKFGPNAVGYAALLGNPGGIRFSNSRPERETRPTGSAHTGSAGDAGPRGWDTAVTIHRFRYWKSPRMLGVTRSFAATNRERRVCPPNEIAATPTGVTRGDEGGLRAALRARAEAARRDRAGALRRGSEVRLVRALGTRPFATAPLGGALRRRRRGRPRHSSSSACWPRSSRSA